MKLAWIVAAIIIIVVILYCRKKKCGKGGKQAGKFGTILRYQQSPKTMKTLMERGINAPIRNIPLPETYDVRDAYPGWTSDVLDQEQCGSCWAFATASVLSDRVRIISKNKHLNQQTTLNGRNILNQLSPYLLAGCDFCDLPDKDQAYIQNASEIRKQGKCNNQCGGGSIAYALIYLQENGLISIACNDPLYRGKYECHNLKNLLTEDSKDLDRSHYCHMLKFGPLTVVSRYHDEELTTADKLLQNEQAIMAEIITNGPVITGFMVHNNFSDFFVKNPGKVYNTVEKTGQEGGHAVSIVGWGVEADGTKYWIIRNSWGPKWNGDGYFRMVKGINFCHCESGVYASTPDKSWLDYVLKFEEGDETLPRLW